MTELTDAEAATVARFEAGEPAPESAVEVVARAMWEAQHDSGCPCTWATTRDVEAHPHFRRLARAALAVMAGPDTTTRAVQLCPKCSGTGLMSRPPGIAGDQQTWTSHTVGPYVCNLCNGAMMIDAAARIRAAVGSRS